METIANLSDKFSWRRMWDFGLMYKKPVRLYIIISALITICSFLLVELIIVKSLEHPQLNVIGLYSIFSVLVALTLFLSPLTFARRDDTLITLMPVKASEKWMFYIIFSFIIIPCILEGIWYGMNFISTSIDPMYNLTELTLKQTGISRDIFPFGYQCLFIMMSIFQTLAMIVTVLYTVIRAKTHRVMKGVLSLVGIFFAIGIISAIYGFAIAMQSFYNASQHTLPFDAIGFIEEMTPMIMILLLIAVSYTIFMTVMTYRQIAKHQTKA